MDQKYKNKSVIGSDETGVGDYFTCLVAAAVYLTYENSIKLEKLGIKDSKKLSDKQITYFDREIKKIVNGNYRIKHLTTKGYNSLNKYYNAHELKTFLHVNAIGGLTQLKPDVIIVDKFVEKENWDKYIKKITDSNRLEIATINQEIFFKNKAEDEHIAVAAASIIARAFMIKKLYEKEEEYKMKFPLGVNKKVIDVAKKFVEKYGEKELYNVAKLSFKTTKEII